MKKVILGLIAFCSVSAFASERVVRLDKNTIISIKISNECKEGTRENNFWYGVRHTISVQTKDESVADFVYESEYGHPSSCEMAKENGMRKQSTLLISLTATKNGTVRVIEKKDNVICARLYTDVVISEDGKLIGSEDGLTPVKCP
jgi:hypothetical protein